MTLRRFQPISRSAQWRERARFVDPRTRLANSLAGATLTLGLYDLTHGEGCRRDYGWPIRGATTPYLSAQTEPDGSGPFVILPDLVQAEWTFPAGTMAGLCGASVLLIVWATVDGATDEVLRATIPVLDGPAAMPAPMPVPITPPTPGPGDTITVIVDGGEV